jgi:hypothetical protein
VLRGKAPKVKRVPGKRINVALGRGNRPPNPMEVDMPEPQRPISAALGQAAMKGRGQPNQNDSDPMMQDLDSVIERSKPFPRRQRRGN